MKAKIEKGEASNYQDASKIIERESVKENIDAKLNYLKKLYSKRSGLNLDDVETSSDFLGGSSIGSAGLGMGMGLQLRQELKMGLEQSLEIEGLKDYINLDLGDSLEGISDRKKMIDWVAPHEIAHLVDWDLSDASDNFTDERKEEIERLAEELSGVGDFEAEEIIKHSLKECLIDGLGFKMALAYGVSNPSLKSQKERTGCCVKAFIHAQNVFENIVEASLEKEQEDGADKECFFRHQIVILRMISSGEMLKKSADQLNVDQNLLILLDNTIKKLQNKFNELNVVFEIMNKENEQDFIKLGCDFFAGFDYESLIQQKREEDTRREREKEESDRSWERQKKARELATKRWQEKQEREKQKKEKEFWKDKSELKQYLDDLISISEKIGFSHTIYKIAEEVFSYAELHNVYKKNLESETLFYLLCDYPKNEAESRSAIFEIYKKTDLAKTSDKKASESGSFREVCTEKERFKNWQKLYKKIKEIIKNEAVLLKGTKYLVNDENILFLLKEFAKLYENFQKSVKNKNLDSKSLFEFKEKFQALFFGRLFNGK